MSLFVILQDMGSDAAEIKEQECSMTKDKKVILWDDYIIVKNAAVTVILSQCKKLKRITNQLYMHHPELVSKPVCKMSYRIVGNFGEH